MLRNVFVFLFVLISINVFSQFSVSGKVTGEGNEALPGANLSVEGTLEGTVTNIDGRFVIDGLKAGSYQIKATFIGYETLVKSVKIDNNKEIDFQLEVSPVMADEVIVVATKAGNKSPIALSNVTKDEIQKSNLGQDLPYLLSLTPSVVTSSDAGAGVGYTSFRIRGTDANRINITVNGIPMNDAESHGVWWVNMPDFASSLENVQVQRGVGTSTNGSGAFGATINMQTNTLRKEAYGEISSAFGSFSTFKNTVKAGTGLLGDHFAFDVRLSKITSDGFVDRASSDLKSFFVSGGYYAKNTILKINVFSGKERTYQSWWGVPKVRLESDLEGMQRYANHWLYTQEETEHMINSDSRTYNYYTYDNETDNYQQDHYQLFFSQKVGDYINLNTALHYTYGRGFYEQYKPDDNLGSYGLNPLMLVSAAGDTITTTDLVRQKWLDNDFYGSTFSLNYDKGPLQVTVGGAYNIYDGRHFGNIIWAQFYGINEKDYEWYRSTGKKKDLTFYGKINYALYDNFNLFADVQRRNITHEIVGIDDKFRNITQTHSYGFWNPKAGFVVNPMPNHQAYASFAVAHREPNRSNFTDADSVAPMPKEEVLFDFEAGYAVKENSYTIGANLYYMSYKDQLILTGEINDVGSAIMVNVDKSYRRGIEIFGGVKIINGLQWDANATISQNKILNFTEYVDNWNTWGQEQNFMEETDIAFSPNFVASSNIQYSPIKNFSIALVSQYVGRQYIDNSSSEDRMLDPYFVNNIRLSYNLELKEIRGIEFTLLVNNLASEEYETNAWVYSYILEGERYAMDGYFPQAGINFLAGATLRF